jgi:formate hydrogenlyase subunit 4
MTLLTGFAAQLLHIALVLAAAPTLIGVIQWIEARQAGRFGPSVLQPWRDLWRLFRKERVIAESASDVSSLAPMVAAAAVAIAACIVPSFALGMTFAPYADLLVIAGLLALARASLALGGLDAGTALGGMGASRTMALAVLSETALLLIIFVLALVAGSSNLDLIAAMQQESGIDWRSGVSLGFAAMLLVAYVDSSRAPSQRAELAMRRQALEQEFSGRDLALISATDSLRILLWFDLLGAMFLPFGMAPSGTGPLAWLFGLACWLARTLLFALAIAIVPAVIGRLRLVRAARMLGVAIALALLAVALLFAEMATA